jgi:hypothetical protein
MLVVSTVTGTVFVRPIMSVTVSVVVPLALAVSTILSPLTRSRGDVLVGHDSRVAAVARRHGDGSPAVGVSELDADG